MKKKFSLSVVAGAFAATAIVAPIAASAEAPDEVKSGVYFLKTDGSKGAYYSFTEWEKLSAVEQANLILEYGSENVKIFNKVEDKIAKLSDVVDKNDFNAAAAPYADGDIAGTFVDAETGDDVVIADPTVANVASVSALDDIALENGGELNLPKTVKATLDDADATEVTLDIDWAENADFDNKVAGEYTFTGTAKKAEGETAKFEIPADKAEVTVKVVVAAGELKVESVSAINATYDTATKGQTLKVLVNDKDEMTAAELVEEGYEVEFQVTNTGILKTGGSKTGELVDNPAAGTYEYGVTVTKGEEEYKSTELATIKVVNLSTTVASLDSYKLANESGTVVVGNTLAITEITGKNGKGEEQKYSADKFTFKSSDTSKALVNANGVITGITAGKATITATSKVNNAVSIEIPVTVAAEEAAIKTVTVEPATAGVVVGNTQTLQAKIVDQYGDAILADSINDLGNSVAVKNADEETIANVTITAGEAGKATVAITGVKAGTGKYDIKVGTKTVGSFDVTVGDAGQVSSRKLEVTTGSTTLDVNPALETPKNTVELAYNKYNNDNLIIGAETDIDDTTGKKYTVTSSDEDVATVEVTENGTITVKGLKAGTATVTIKEGTITRATETITVTNSSPKVTDVKFEEKSEVTSLSTALTDLLATTGITITSNESVVKFDYNVDGKTVAFVDVEGTTATVYNAGSDIKLADINVIPATADEVTLDTSGNVVVSRLGAEPFVLKVTANDAASTVYTKTINVAITPDTVPADAVKESTVTAITAANAMFLVGGLTDEAGLEKPSTLDEVKTFIDSKYGVDFKKAAIKFSEVEGTKTITVEDGILSAADWAKVKANSVVTGPYRITLLKDNATAIEDGENAGKYANDQRELRIAMYGDGKTALQNGAGQPLAE